MLANVKTPIRRRAVQRVVEGTSPLSSDLLKTLLEGSQYIYLISATIDGALSFEAKICACCAAVEAYYTAQRVAAQAAGQSCDYEYPRVMGTGDSAFVYEYKNKLYRVDYTLVGTTATLSGEPIEVTAEFSMLAEESAPVDAHEAREVDLVQQTDRVFAEASLDRGKIDREHRVIRDTVLINAVSLNRRVYTEKALRQIAEMGEGLPAYRNHAPPGQASAVRPVEELIGRHRRLRYEASKQRVLSDLHLTETSAPFVFDLAEHFGDVVGNSLVSRAMSRMDASGTEIVESIVLLKSGDLVSEPATTRGFFEQRDPAASAAPPSQGGIIMEYTLDGLLAWLKDPKNTVALSAVREEIAGQDLKRIGDKLILEESTHATTKASLKTTTEELDGFKLKESLATKRTAITEAIAAHELGKKYGHLPATASAAFVESLISAPEDTWKTRLDDRLAFVTEAVKPPVSTVRSALKGDTPAGGMEMTESQRHAAMHQAFTR